MEDYHTAVCTHYYSSVVCCTYVCALLQLFHRYRIRVLFGQGRPLAHQHQYVLGKCGIIVIHWQYWYSFPGDVRHRSNEQPFVIRISRDLRFVFENTKQNENSLRTPVGSQRGERRPPPSPERRRRRLVTSPCYGEEPIVLGRYVGWAD